jgi:hypothetical protein
MSNLPYLHGLQAAMTKFALSTDFISRAITNKATQTGARLAPNLLESISGNRPALMSLAKNVRAPGAITPTAPQNALHGMLNKFDFFGGEMNHEGAAQLPKLRQNLGATGRIRSTGGPLQLEQNITQQFGQRPGLRQPTPSEQAGTAVATPRKMKQQTPGLNPLIQ